MIILAIDAGANAQRQADITASFGNYFLNVLKTQFL